MSVPVSRLQLIPLPDTPWLVQPSPCQGPGFAIYLTCCIVILLAAQQAPIVLSLVGSLALGIGVLFTLVHQGRARVQYCPDCLRRMPRTAHRCQCGRTDGQACP